MAMSYNMMINTINEAIRFAPQNVAGAYGIFTRDQFTFDRDAFEARANEFKPSVNKKVVEQFGFKYLYESLGDWGWHATLCTVA